MQDPNLVALLIAWTAVMCFVTVAVGVLNLPLVMELLARALLYLPRVLIALGILSLGTVLSALSRRAVLVAAENAGLPPPRELARALQAGIITVVVGMALTQLELAHHILATAFAILFAGSVAAIMLALGLGSWELARDLPRRVMIFFNRRQSRGDPHPQA